MLQINNRGDVDGYIMKWGDLSGSTGIQNGKQNTGLVYAFPNPTEGKFTIICPPQYKKIKVYNSIGVEITSINLIGDKESYQLDNLEAGVYYLNIISDKDAISQKVLIK